MNRKNISFVWALVMCLLLVTGCAEGPQKAESASDPEAAQEEAAQVLPADAKIGIADVREEGEFTNFFVAKLSSYLVSAGIPQDGIERRTGNSEELSKNAADLIKAGCSVLIIGNADETTAPAVTDAAVEAEIPLLYFGTSPGEKEIARWEKEGWKVSFIESTYDGAAAKRADLFDAIGSEKIDQSEDERIGVVVLDSGGEKAGDAVNRDSISVLKERGYDINALTEAEKEDSDSGETDGGNSDSGKTDEENSDSGEAEGTSDAEQETADTEDAGNDLREDAKQQVIEWMDEYGRELEVILCCDDTRALGAMDAVTEEKKKVGHDVMILGFDCNTQSLREVASGTISGTFFNDFLGQAGTASEAVLAFLRGDDVAPVTTCELVSVTVDNAQEILDISLKTQESTQAQEEQEETER